MAVAALSTAAPALTAGPAPAPTLAAGTESSLAFAKLVTEARPDGKAPQDGANAEPEADGETATAFAEDGATTGEADAAEKPAGKPADLLSQIEAMVAAASQIGVSQPAAAPAAVPMAPETQAEPAVATPAEAPAFTMPFSARFARQATIISPANPHAAASAPQAVTLPEAPAVASPPAPVAIPPQVVADEAPTPVATTAAATPVPKSIPSDIAAMIASLKAAFEPARSVAEPVTTQISTTPPVVGTTAAIPAEAPIAAVARNLVETTPAMASEPVAAGPTGAPDVKPTASATIQPPVAPIDPAIIKAIAAEMQAAPAKTAESDKLRAVPSTGKQDGPQYAPIADQIMTTAPDSVSPAIETPAPMVETVTDIAAVPTDAPTSAASPAPQAEALVSAAASRPADNVAVVSDAGNIPLDHADLSIQRHLDLARDTQWLDRLARDISQAATQQGQLKFQLNPENLGALTIEIANSAAGTSIKLSTETDQARQIIADAQPRLLAEVRAQGLRVAETHVDLNQQGSGGSASAQGQQRQSSEDHKPFARTQSVIREDAGDSAPADDGELYA